MADRKRSTSRSQMAEPKARGSEKGQPARNARATAREERKEQPKKEQPKQESKTVRREVPKAASPTWLARLRSTSIGRFIAEAYYELRHKVTWPTFVEARNMTIAVIVISLAIGALLGLADLGLLQLWHLIIGR